MNGANKMDKTKWSFDGLFRYTLLKVPYLGKPISEYYINHTWFQRLVKYGFSTLIVYWLVKAPLIAIFTTVLPSIFYIPSYLIGAFFAGLIVTVIGFFLGEVWIWREK